LRVGPLYLPQPIPDREDVFLRPVEECPADYTLSRCCGLPQIRCRSYAEAFEAARRWARTHHADVWFNDGDRTLALLSRHRPDGPPTSAPCRLRDHVIVNE
jgi:hypothetical protein